jgi:hypothetical protein
MTVMDGILGGLALAIALAGLGMLLNGVRTMGDKS